MEQRQLVKVLVGSRAHGLNRPDSDYDYRGVYLVPTSELLKIGGKVKGTTWFEGNVDNTAWELGHFLQLATKCNPTILEVFHAPVEQVSRVGQRVLDIFPYVWNKRYLVDSHIGYSENQRKKFLEDKDGRTWKYATAYLRTLYQAWALLAKDVYPVDMTDTVIFDKLKQIRDGGLSKGDVINLCEHWKRQVLEAADKHKGKETDIDKVNQLLLDIRMVNW